VSSIPTDKPFLESIISRYSKPKEFFIELSKGDCLKFRDFTDGGEMELAAVSAAKFVKSVKNGHGPFAPFKDIDAATASYVYHLWHLNTGVGVKGEDAEVSDWHPRMEQNEWLKIAWDLPHLFQTITTVFDRALGDTAAVRELAQLEEAEKK
jgi:hypothetical protein